MNLNVSKRKNGRIYLYIEKSYRDRVTGKPKKKNIKTLGYVDELEKQYPDPIAHFREVARQMTLDEKSNRQITLTIDMNEDLPMNAEGSKNFGYAVPMKIYHELGLDQFIKNRSRSEKFEFNANSIMILLVISRLLSPGSKLKAYEEKRRYFERFDFSKDDVYRALTYFDKISENLQQYLHESVRMKYKCDTSIVYYDVTNYYFEIKKPDEYRKHGRCKQNRKKPIIQMGLAMDKEGIPLHYELFPGNCLDKETFRSVIGKVRKDYDTGRVVVVADMGIITGDNIYYLTGDIPEKPRNGYIFSFSVRGGTKAFKSYVLDEEGYMDGNGNPVEDGADFKVKDRITYRDINVTMGNGKIQKRKVYEKQVVFWSKKYYIKARSERAEMLAKAEALIANPGKFNKDTSYGAAAYVKNLEYDKKTGEVLDTGKALYMNEDKIAEEEKYDGYYSIVTSELHMSVDEIISTYRGLWEIEETFKITKSDLEARPFFVSEYSHINAHILTCFIALTILRLMQQKTNGAYSAGKILECLNKIQCSHEDENIYLFNYRNEITDAIGSAFGIDFTKKRRTLLEIKKILGDTKI
jgi:transposase